MLIRRLLDQPAPPWTRITGDYRIRLRTLFGIDLDRCPCCGGAMRTVAILAREAPHNAAGPRAPPSRSVRDAGS